MAMWSPADLEAFIKKAYSAPVISIAPQYRMPIAAFTAWWLGSSPNESMTRALPSMLRAHCHRPVTETRGAFLEFLSHLNKVFGARSQAVLAAYAPKWGKTDGTQSRTMSNPTLSQVDTLPAPTTHVQPLRADSNPSHATLAIPPVSIAMRPLTNIAPAPSLTSTDARQPMPAASSTAASSSSRTEPSGLSAPPSPVSTLPNEVQMVEKQWQDGMDAASKSLQSAW